MKWSIFLTLILAQLVLAQRINESRFFYHPLFDASLERNHLEAAIISGSYSEYSSIEYMKIEADYRFGNLTLGGEVSFPDDGGSHPTEENRNLNPYNFAFAGKYNFSISNVQVSSGTMLEFDPPITTFFYSIFSSVGLPINDQMRLCGLIRIRLDGESKEVDELFGISSVLFLAPALHSIIELGYSGKTDIITFGGGLDYAFIDMLSLRSSLFFNQDYYNYILSIGLSYSL